MIVMNIEIEIQTLDKGLIFDLLGKSTPSRHEEVQILEGVSLRYDGSRIPIRKGADFPEIAKFVLTWVLSIPASMIAAWLYGKLKGKEKTKLIIEKREVEIDQGEIKRIIEEKIRIE